MKKSKVGYLIIAFLLAWLLAQFFFYSVTCTATELPPQLTISRTQYIRTQEHNQRAGELTDAAGSEIKAAGTDIARAIENIERAESIANQNAGTLEECRDIVSTLKVLSGEAKSILADVKRANKEAEGR